MITKTNCRHCGGHLEFEAEDAVAGMQISCPHCDHATPLVTRPARTLTRARPSWRWIAIWFVVVVMLALMIPMLVKLMTKLAVEDYVMATSLLGWAFFGLIALVLTVMWIAFPFFVYTGMRRLEALLKQIERNTKER